MPDLRADPGLEVDSSVPQGGVVVFMDWREVLGAGFAREEGSLSAQQSVLHNRGCKSLQLGNSGASDMQSRAPSFNL